MKNKKSVVFLLALGVLGVSVISVGRPVVTKAEELDLADQSFLEFVLSDTEFTGDVEYTHSPLYNEDLQVHGRQYDFTVGGVSGYALLAEIQSANKTFYEIEELFYNKQSPFDECEGLPVYITHQGYLDYKNEAFYDVTDGSLVTDTIVEEYAYRGFGYCGAWEFTPYYQTVSYATKTVSQYSIQYDLPNYFGPVGTTCASTAGTVLVAYYDRFYEGLIPNYQVYTRFGSTIRYKPSSETTATVSNELYNLMGGELEHIGTTYSEFQDGMNAYVSNKGYTYTTTSLFTGGSFDFAKYKNAVENGKPVALFLNSFAIKLTVTANNGVDTISNEGTNTPHVVIGCGYEQHKYFNVAGQEIDNRIYLKVATSLNSYQIGYLNINGLTVINHAISVEIS